MHACRSTLEDPTLAAGYYWLTRARLANWEGDAEVLAALERGMREGPDFPLRPVALAAARLRIEPLAPAIIRALVPTTTNERALRRRAFASQMGTEFTLLSGHQEAALGHLEEADAANLLDVAWLTRCPLLAPLHGTARFEAVRASTARRAEEVRAALPPEVAQ